METTPKNIAWFITPHGFGHAARAAAAMLALESLIPVHFHIYTRVPEWFFRESHLQGYTYHECLTDIGLVQKNSMEEDLPATLENLAAFYPIDPARIARLANEVTSLACCAVVCDIAPMGIAVAQQAGLPSILVENFLWDWIYAGYPAQPSFDKYIKLLGDLFSRADDHIQTQPVCDPQPASLTTFPVSRPVRTPRSVIREQLNISESATAILITMGGIETSFDYLAGLEKAVAYHFIIPGGSPQAIQRGNLRLLPHHSGFYHPDLVAASDAIIGKLGYSTLSEASTAGIPFGFIPRKVFRESPPLSSYAKNQMSGIEISGSDYAQNTWLEMLPSLLAQPKKEPPQVNGADQIANWLMRYLM